MNKFIKLREITFLTILFILSDINISVGETDETRVEYPRIVIIGAGPSGIAAASKLFENGFTNVTILEAENRIGGRVYTTKLGDYDVDLGGQWVHGEKGNVAFELANLYGLLEKQDESELELNQEFFDSLGNPINNEIEKQVTTFFIKHFIDEEIDYKNNYESVGEYAERMFDEDFRNNSEIIKDKKKYLHHIELLLTSWDPAESYCQISAASSDSFQECEGDQKINWKTRGYSTILDILMKRYPDPDKELPVMKNIMLNNEVMSIDYLHDVEGPPVLITTTTAQLYKADHVIVTVSLGVLKEKHKSLFIPPLPETKSQTIEAIAFGNAAKIFLLFDEPFWDLENKRSVHYAFIWNEAERKTVESDPENSWVIGLTGVMTVEHKPNLLELWISGKYAREMEIISEDKVYNQTVAILHQFLNKRFNVTKPIAMLRTQWYTNPHFRGTYSYRSVETQKRNATADSLEEPITQQNLRLLFAGEATSSSRYSTVDGAIGSGWKAADRLIDHYKNNDKRFKKID